MKLDQKNVAKILESVDLSQIQDKLKGIDLDIEPEAIQKLFKSLNIKEAQKAMKILKSNDVQNSLNKISNYDVEGFTSNIEGMVDYNALQTIINNFNLKKMTKPEKDYTIDSTTTINARIEASKNDMMKTRDNIDALTTRLKTKINVNGTLDMIKGFFDTETREIKSSYKDNLKKKKINKRLIEFYDRDASSKKDMIVYLKYIYYFFIAMFVFTIFYKKRHKDKKLYGVLLLLFLIPNFLIFNAYKLSINIVGHTKLDLLYTFMIIITTILIVALFFIFKFALKSTGGDMDNLLNIAKVTSSIKNSIKSKSKDFKKNITGDNKPNQIEKNPAPEKQKQIENKDESDAKKLIK
jgi:hypothetical protein